MKYKFVLFRLKFREVIGAVKLQGFGLTMIFALSALILSVNILNVINRGRFNYDTYVYEKQTLETLQAELDEKIDTYDYVTSEEYKQLLLREGYGYGKSNQTLYRTKDPVISVIEDEEEYLDAELEGPYEDWWLKLLF